jgi:predicted HTH domain antitoxin
MPLTIPDEILVAAHIAELELKRELALALFQQERLTLGRASSLAGMSPPEFQRLLANRRIPIHYGVEDFEQDLRTLRQMGPSLIVISDTSPILNLALIRRLDLLVRLYVQVLTRLFALMARDQGTVPMSGTSGVRFEA